MQAERRLDIQGLRALAVMLVLVFHLRPWLLPGGYIGVDIFFVISGYLITSHLIREIRLSGRVNLGKFWARRARRLLPASLVVLVACVILVLTLMPALSRIQNLRDINFAAVFGVNWLFAYDAVDYLGSDSSGSIVQHYWSLAVEEQFYLIWPLLLLLVALVAAKVSRYRKSSLQRSTAPFLIVIAIVFVASLIYSVYETSRSQPVAYMITPTRMWELAAGGLIAFAPAPSHFAHLRGGSEHAESGFARFMRIAHPILSWLAWVAILACAFLFGADSAFPGALALMPVIATAYLLWQQPAPQWWSPQRLSEFKPVQWLGDISYPLYLWHWPLIVVFLAVRHNYPGKIGVLALAVVAVLLAWGTKVWVEDPLRFRVAAFTKPRIMLPVAGLGIVAVLAAALVPSAMIRAGYQANYALYDHIESPDESCLGALALINGCDAPFARTSTVNAAAARNDSYRTRGIRDCPQMPNFSGDLEIDCMLSDPSNPKRSAVLVGDSFSAQFAVSLGDAAERLNWRLTERTLTGCGGFMPDPGNTDNVALLDCAAWGEETFQKLEDDSTVDIVIISIRTLDSASAQASAAVAESRIRTLIATGKQVVLIHNGPGFSGDVPACVESHPGDDPCAQPEGGRNDWLTPAAIAAGADLIELRALLCPERLCHTVIGGTVAYFDGHHLTHSFSSTLSYWFEERLNELDAAHHERI